METLVLYIFTCVGACHVVNCQTLAQSKTLMSDMLSDYDKRHRPVLDQSKPVLVNVSFDIIAIQDFNEIDETFSVVGTLIITWIDENIKWDPKSYGNIWHQMYRSEDVWYPLLVLGNPYKTLTDIGDDWMTVRVVYNGFAYFTPGAVFKSTCSADVTYYPFDTQKCELLFIPWGYSNTELKLATVRSDVTQSFYSENGEWELESTQAVHSSTGSFNNVSFTFNIKRKPLFLVVNVILPIIFMAVINILVFLLPVESGERVSFATTVLLALAVFLTLVGDNLPKTSQPMSLLCYFLTIILIISTLMCVMTIFNLHLYYKSTKVPRWIASLTLCLMCTGTSRCKRHNKVEHIETHNKINGIHRCSISSYKEPTEQTARIIAFAEELEDVTYNITWKEVCSVLDKLSAVLFAFTLFVTVLVYMDILVSNKQP